MAESTAAMEKLKIMKQRTVMFNFKPKIVKAKDNLIAVGIKDNIVYVRPINTYTIKNFEFRLNIPKLTAEDVIEAVSLGNGKIVIKTIANNDFIEVERIRQLLLIVIDLDIYKYFTKEESLPMLLNFKSFLPYHNTFDVFFAKVMPLEVVDLKPKRYSDKAESIEMPYSLGPEGDASYCSISTIEPNDPTKGYINFCRYLNGTSVLQLLNSKFEIVKQVDADHPVDSFSTGYGNISMCYSTPSGAGLYYAEGIGPWERQRVTCEIRDLELKHKAKIDMHQVHEGKYYAYSAIHNLPDGSAIVILTEDHLDPKDPNNRPHKVYVQRITADGHAGKPAKFREFSNIYYVQGILLNNNEFCLVVIKGPDRLGDYMYPIRVEVNYIDISN